MKKSFSQLSLFFKSIDLFGVPNSLVFGNTTVYKSKFSGFISSWVYIFLIVMISLEIKKIQDKENARVKLFTTQQGLPDEIHLDKDTIMLAFRLNLPSNLTQHLMKIEVEYIQRSFFLNGSQNQNIKKLPIEPCTIQHFISTDQEMDADTEEVMADLLKQNITSWLCPLVNTSVNLSGTFGKEYFNYLKIKFLTCMNQSYYNQTTGLKGFNPVCTSSQKEFDDVYNKGKTIEIDFLHINYLITPDDLIKPSKKFVDSSMYYRFNPRMQKIQSDFFFRKYFITDFDKFFKPKDSTTSLFILKDTFDFRDQVTYSAEKQVNNSQELATIYIRRSPFTHNAQRVFTDLGTILSFVGGLISVLITIGDMIMGQYNNISYLKTIVNNCYGFVDQATYDMTSKQIDTISGLKTELNYNYFSIFSNEAKAIQQATLFTRMTHPFKIKLPIPILFICSCLKTLRSRKKIYLIGMEMIKQDLNALRIIRAIHDVERIKNILMTEEQKRIFRKLPNPLVVMNSSIVQQKDRPLLPTNTKKTQTRIIPEYFNEMFYGFNNFSGLDTQQQKNHLEIQSQTELYKILAKFLEEEHDFENKSIEFQVSSKLIRLIDEKQLAHFNIQERNKQLLPKEKFQDEFAYPIISDIAMENDISFAEEEFFENKTGRLPRDPEILVSNSEALNLILVGSGVLLRNDSLEVSFSKSKDSLKQKQMLFIISIKNHKNQIIKVEIAKRSSKVLDVAINKSYFQNNLEVKEYQVYLTISLFSIYQKLSEMDKSDVLDWLMKNILTIELLIVKKNSRQLIQIPFFNIKEQFFSDESTKMQTPADTFTSLLRRKETCLKYIGNKQEEITLKITPPSIISVKPLQVDKQTSVIIRFFLSILKQQFKKS